jgi:hypothetical protein
MKESDRRDVNAHAPGSTEAIPGGFKPRPLP